MISPNFPTFYPGDVLSAADLEYLAWWVERLSRVSASPPIDIYETSQGYHFRLAEPEIIWVKIAGGTNPYSWTKQVPTAGGNFANDASGQIGTTLVDPAYEINGNAAITVGTFVKLVRSYSTGQWLFQRDTC